MNILSCFDGLSCGQIALNRAGIKYVKYYSAEIDKYAIQITQKNYPNTIQLGDIKNVTAKSINDKIDLILGGFPCQSFSLAGKQLNFNDPRGQLLFECLRLIKELSPKYFLLENVQMKKEFQDAISDLIGVQPILINSALVSGQNRKRNFWTNIPIIEELKDRKIMIEDILPKNSIPVIKSHGKFIHKPYKAQCIDANYWKGVDNHGQRTVCIDVTENQSINQSKFNMSKINTNRMRTTSNYSNKLHRRNFKYSEIQMYWKWLDCRCYFTYF